MKNVKSAADIPLRCRALTRFGLTTIVPLASVAVLLTACGGGGGGNGGSNGGGSSAGDGGQSGPTPILAVGMQRKYTGATTRSIVYTNPTGTQQNNTLSYNFNETVNVLQAAANTGAQFDVQANYAYTITQDPGTGVVPLSQTTDTFENLNFNGATQQTLTLGETSSMQQNDETNNAALGTGPYTITTNSGYTYTTPVPGLSFPLQSGATLQLPFAEIIMTNYQDVNAAGAAPSNGSNSAYTSQETRNNDGSYSIQSNRVNGVTTTSAMNSDGSGAFSSSGGTTAYSATIGVPVLTTSGYTIPVNYTTTAPSASSKTYTAADWYPGGAMPPSPLASQTKTVVGPATTLPSACNGALLLPNTFEVDTTETSLVTTGTYVVISTQAFNANGAVVCSLQTETNTSYDIYTGAVNSTTTTQTTTLLTGLSTPN